MTKLGSGFALFSLVLLCGLFTHQAHAQKNVFCHYMMGNSYNSDVPFFQNDISLAAGAGIDGFALNIGPDDWMPDRISKMFTAAGSYPSFKLFFSFDMSVMSNVQDLINYVVQYHSNPNYFIYEGKTFVSTFAGQDLTFGSNSVNDGWQNQFKDPLQNQGIPIFFIPSWTILGTNNIFEDYPVLDGMFSWDAWPKYDDTMDSDEDRLYMQDAAKNGKAYMAGVSPWFFTHFSYKNWISKSETLWENRWQEMFTLQPDFIEIITWNDFGESTYIGPIEGAMPAGSEAWVDGYTHLPWLNMASFYIKAYKTGVWPAVPYDQIYFWYRTTSKNTQCNDPLGLPNYSQWADDIIVIYALLTADSQVQLTNGGASQTFYGIPGGQIFTMPFQDGTVSVSLIRNGQTLASKTGDLPIGGCGSGYNFNAYVAEFTYQGDSIIC